MNTPSTDAIPLTPAYPCPLCGAERQCLAEISERPFHYCPRCDLVTVPPSWHLSRDDECARYRLHENTIGNAGYVDRFHALIAMLREKAPRTRRVLDYGCGPMPIFVELLRRAGYEAVGYDPFFAPEADLAHPFDAVVSVETFEHFADPASELRRIGSMIRPGGCLTVMTQFHNGPESFKEWWYARDPTHVAFYSPATFQWIGSAYGWEPALIDNKQVAMLFKTPYGDETGGVDPSSAG